MKIIDISEEYLPSYFLCLEDWSDEIKEAGQHKKRYYEKMKEKGLQVKLAVDDAGALGGMIQYLPIENSHLQGKDLYFILCIWVHGHKQGRGNFQKMGMGAELLKAAEEDARSRGAKGMAGWGVILPFWMKASWLKKHGYKKADRQGIMALLWKPFQEGAVAPKWNHASKKVEPVPGKVTVSAFLNGWCPASNMVFERAKRACAELGDKVEFREYDTSDPAVFREWGLVDDIFVNGKKITSGPPLSYKKIYTKIAREAGKIK